MNITYIMPARRRASAAACAVCLLAAVFSGPALTQPANRVTEAFQHLTANTLIAREITLAEIGVTKAITLSAADAAREIYLPVPPGIALTDATLRFDASYERADSGASALALSLDTFPVSARKFEQARGDAGIALGVDGSARPSGQVRLGVAWSANGQDSQCGALQKTGNVLRIEPGTRFSYRYDGAAVHDLASALNALPATPLILIGAKLDRQAYDTAWRVGLALERAGKHAKLMALPAVGDVIDLGRVTVPAGLETIPAYAAIAAGGKYTIKNAAEIGALLAMGQDGPIRPDLMLGDPRLAAALTAALDALAVQVQSAGPESAAAYAAWRKRAMEPALAPLGDNELRLATALGRPVMVVGSGAGIKAAVLISEFRFASSPAVAAVNQAVAAAGNPTQVTAQQLGGQPGSFELRARRDWNARFDIGAISKSGWLPAKAVFDVAAGAAGGARDQVVSLYLNDVLLAARLLSANGKTERISAQIPRYALASRNILRLSFQRKLNEGECPETTPPSSSTVLPSSHVVLASAQSENHFVGMIPRFADTANLLIPDSYLRNAALNLPWVIRIAETMGVSPLHAQLMAADADLRSQDAPFLAFDPPSADARELAHVSGSTLSFPGVRNTEIINQGGPNGVGIAQVTRQGARGGVIFQTLGNMAAASGQAVSLANGNVAVIGQNGIVAEVDTHGRDGPQLVSISGDPWHELWRKNFVSWIVSAIALTLFVILLISATIVRRRKTNSNS